MKKPTPHEAVQLCGQRFAHTGAARSHPGRHLHHRTESARDPHWHKVTVQSAPFFRDDFLSRNVPLCLMTGEHG